MKSTTFMTLVAAVVSFTSPAFAGTIKPLDVWAPKITEPTSKTVWHKGEVRQVKWDTSDAPSSISNRFSVTLSGTTLILADGFDPLKGAVNVTVPWLRDGSYSITLFGDSGNLSPTFRILGA